MIRRVPQFLLSCQGEMTQKKKARRGTGTYLAEAVGGLSPHPKGPKRHGRQALEKMEGLEREPIPQRLLTAKLMSGTVCFEPISKSALYQGTTSVVPKRGVSRTRALAPA